MKEHWSFPYPGRGLSFKLLAGLNMATSYALWTSVSLEGVGLLLRILCDLVLQSESYK